MLGADHRAAQSELSGLALQCDGTHGCVYMFTVDCNTAASRGVTAKGSLRAAKVARDSLFCNATTTKRRANRMEAALINLCTLVDDCLCAYNLCHSTNQSAVNSGLGTFVFTLIWSLSGYRDGPSCL